MAVSDEVKERLDIVEVVGQYVTGLKKAGRNYKAVCPFHTEKTPSFIVFPDRQTWRCFGACATGGDTFSFVMRMEKMDFGDALKLLAQRAGVDLPQRKAREEHQSLYDLNALAAAFFQELLYSRRGEAARAYLEQRGVDTQATELFQLGLSPGGGDELLAHLAAKGVPHAQAVAAGLAIAPDDGPGRDMFRGRLMIPIRDDHANLVGFGGRALDGPEPKYLNSPRTPVFDKSRILYGLHLAKGPIKERGEGVIVEGYMDVIAAHQHGFGNVVASMGTALTEAQVNFLQAHGQKYVLALDPDTAGQEATFRSLEGSWRVFERRVVGARRGVTLYERPLDVSLRVAVLPSGKDPDQVIRERPAHWEQLIQQAAPLPDYLLGTAPHRWDLTTSEGKAQAHEYLFPLLSGMGNPFERERSIRRLAELLGVRPETLAATLARPTRVRSQRRQTTASPTERESHDPHVEYLLALLLQWPDLKEAAGQLTPEAIGQMEDREIFTLWLKCSTLDRLRDTLDEELRGRVDGLLVLSLPPMDHLQREKAVRESVHRLEERWLRNLKIEEALLLERQGEVEGIESQAMDTNDRLRRLFDIKNQGSRSG